MLYYADISNLWLITKFFNIEPFAGAGGLMHDLTSTNTLIYTIIFICFILIITIIKKIIASGKGKIQLRWKKSWLSIEWEK